MYPVPPRPETQGRTEIALGKWLKSVPRHNVVVATKVCPLPAYPIYDSNASVHGGLGIWALWGIESALRISIDPCLTSIFRCFSLTNTSREEV